jgi:hypothetical protein
MLNMKCFFIQVNNGVTRINNTRKAFSRFSIKKIAVLGTSHIIRKVLQSEISSLECWGAPLVREEKYQGKENL